MIQNLTKSVKYLKTVGPKRAEILGKLGIYTVYDLLTFFPRDYEDRRQYKKIAELKYGEVITISCKVEVSNLMSVGPKLKVFKSAVSDSTGVVYAVFYRKHSYKYDVFKKLKEDFRSGNRVILHGKVEKFRGVQELNVEEYELLTGNDADLIHTNRIVPLYPLTEGLTNRYLRTLIKSALPSYSRYFQEIVPEKYITGYNLISINDAVRQIHFPDSYESKEKARVKLVFDEFLLLQIAMEFSKRQLVEKNKTYTYQLKKHLLSPFRQNLGFDFTKSQKKVINEIFRDMQSRLPMNRLLLGDVGSGKTVVALSAILLAIENGYQTALMAPTEILAEQHYYTIKHFLKGLNVRTELLVGSTSAKNKKSIKQKLAEGEIDLIIGTHAIIEQKTEFKNLSLIVIDEQHRFGVIQRKILREKGFSPDVLVMTATPIPRTLALTLYGDLDVSVIEEMPPGRQPITTKYATERESYEFVKKEVSNGHQAYIVFPLVEESDKIELKAAVQESKRLSEKIFSDFAVGLLHGQLKGSEKEKIMIDFRNGKYDILITTTVIEIGIDVPNATVMVIEHSDRFGLATLHQLRGRIGRGKEHSVCFLLGELKTEEAKKRIEILVSTNDGFEIGREDLKMRGPGEFFGTQQHGLLDLKIGNLVTDGDIINKTKTCVQEIVNSDRFLSKPENHVLKSALQRQYGGRFGLPQIG